MIREFSAGGIIVNSHNQVLLIKNAAMRDPCKSYWGFPKGHIKTGESSEDAAIREVEEETGIKVKIIKKLGDSKYIFSKNNQKIFKVVIYFLMEYLEGDLAPQQEEILELRWTTLDEALELLSFEKDKQFLKKASISNHEPPTQNP